MTGEGKSRISVLMIRISFPGERSTPSQTRHGVPTVEPDARSRWGNVLWVGGKASFRLKVLQENAKAKQVVIGFAIADQIEFFGRECKVVNQLLVGPLSLHDTSTSFLM
jgi:hypothetical protein